MTKSERRNLRNGLLFVSPWIVGFVAFTVYPVIMSFWYSLCDYSVFEKPVFIGLQNYIELVHDDVFWISMWNTFYFAAVAIPVGLVFSTLIALLLNANVRGMPVFRTFYYLPTLVPPVALAILWMWILNGQFGLINHALSWVGIQGPNWLNEKYLVIPAFIVMGLWVTGRTIVIILAGLQDVPAALYEAASIDGAGGVQKVFHVTLPMISPVLYFNVVMGIIGCLQIFGEAYIMTGGGPGRASTFYTLYLFQIAFEDYRMGYASAMAWILFLMILVLTLVANKLSRKVVFYRGRGS